MNWKIMLTSYPKMFCVTSRPAYDIKYHTVYQVAMMSLPCDSPWNCIPIWTVGDRDYLT